MNAPCTGVLDGQAVFESRTVAGRRAADVLKSVPGLLLKHVVSNELGAGLVLILQIGLHGRKVQSVVKKDS